MLALLDKDFKAVVRKKTLQGTITKKNRKAQQRNSVYEEEPNGNFRTEKNNN